MANIIFYLKYSPMNFIMPNKPFYQMDLQELRAYFIKVNGKLERKRKTRRKYRIKRRKTARK